MEIYIRITIRDMEDEEFLELKKALTELLGEKEGVSFEITMVSLPPTPPE